MRVMFGFAVGVVLTAGTLLVLQSVAGVFTFGDKLIQRVCSPAGDYCVEQHTRAGLPLLRDERHVIEIHPQAHGGQFDRIDDPFVVPVTITWRDGDAVLDDGRGVSMTITREFMQRPAR